MTFSANSMEDAAGEKTDLPRLLEEVSGLLRLKHRGRFEDGYLDVLGDRDPIGRRFGQRMFASRFIPLVYERFSRPMVARFVLFGRGMPVAEERRITLDLLELSPDRRVLDVGCGPGNYTRLIAEAVQDGLAVGLDPSKPMIEAAVSAEGGPDNVCYVRGDGSDLPFVDSAFDAVCCVGSLHMIDDPMQALDEMVRVLHPGGRLALVTTWNSSEQARMRSGMTIFGRDQIEEALAARGCSRIRKQVVKNAQFIAASKQPEDPNGD